VGISAPSSTVWFSYGSLVKSASIYKVSPTGSHRVSPGVLHISLLCPLHVHTLDHDLTSLTSVTASTLVSLPPGLPSLIQPPPTAREILLTHKRVTLGSCPNPGV
jgi:hypothetical protein